MGISDFFNIEIASNIKHNKYVKYISNIFWYFSSEIQIEVLIIAVLHCLNQSVNNIFNFNLKFFLSLDNAFDEKKWTQDLKSVYLISMSM